MTDAEPNKRMNKLKALRQSYSSQLPKRMVDIELAWQSLVRGDKTIELRQNFHHLVHGLAGSAGTFGYMDISEKARTLEHSIQFLVDNESSQPRALMIQIAKNIDELSHAIEHDQPTALPELIENMPHPSSFEETLPRPIEVKVNNRILFVIENEPEVAEEITAQLTIYGWNVHVFANTAQAKLALEAKSPTAILVDITLCEKDIDGADFIMNLKYDLNQSHIPTIVASTRWDWRSRLAAARAGVDAYYVKPLDFTALAERLDKLMLQQYQAPFRILIVEDEKLLAAHYAEVLIQANMQVRTVLLLSEVLETLDNFEPELLLLDLYMPQCSGIEIAKVIRQDDKFNDLPIVFLSTESGRQLQLAAMQSGADDFLQKPINNTELITAVTARATRFRALRQLIRQDSMTGVLNHIALKLQLEIEISRHQRSQTAMSMVMLDLDKFKQVNDSYGHPMGDRVIKSLAQLLRKRLRKTDIIGRYGGEEFAIVMANTPLEEAEKVINMIREQFAKIHHISDVAECSCTFSAGISAFPRYSTVADIIDASDQALYQAKSQGRNQVCLYS